MELSIIIPAHNEQDCIAEALVGIVNELGKENIENEIIVVDDNSTDSTAKIVADLAKIYPNIKLIRRNPPRGFGKAIQEGLTHLNGEVVATVMGDLSDDPRDIVKCFRKIHQGYDCVFGSRFIKGSMVKDYPLLKLAINRLANNFIRVLFLIKANDITNAFKVYRRKVIEAVLPLEASYFNITVELPLKAIVKGFSFIQIPIKWYGRKSGVSKLGIREMGYKYLFTVLCVWLEKLLLKGKNQL